MKHLPPPDQQPTYPSSIQYERVPQPPAARKPRRNHVGCVIVGVTVGACLLACGILALALAAAIGSGIHAISGNPRTPTSTPAPTTTATPTPFSQRISYLVMSTVTGASASTTMTGNQMMVTVSISYDETFPPSVAAEICKDNAFDEMKALYTSGIPVAKVDLSIQGAPVDPGSGTTIGPNARVTLTAATAAHFNWSQLTADTAWQYYDSAYVQTSIP